MMHRMYSRFAHNFIQTTVRRKILHRGNKLLLGYRHDRDIFKPCFTIKRSLCSGDEDNILRSPFSDVIVPDVPLPSFLWDHNVDIRGDTIALVCLEISLDPA